MQASSDFPCGSMSKGFSDFHIPNGFNFNAACLMTTERWISETGETEDDSNLCSDLLTSATVWEMYKKAEASYWTCEEEVVWTYPEEDGSAVSGDPLAATWPSSPHTPSRPHDLPQVESSNFGFAGHSTLPDAHVRKDGIGLNASGTLPLPD